jgi:hypothetical protein
MSKFRKWSFYVSGEFVEDELLPIEMSHEDVMNYVVLDLGYPRSETEVVQHK